jgi:cyanophycinase
VAFIHQRTIGVVGKGAVHIAPHYHVQNDGDVLRLTDSQIADCTALRRMCTLGPRFRRIDDEPPVCEVPDGSLMIVGGGGFTDEMLNRFVELAGGEEARIVIVPSAEENPQVIDRQDASDFLNAGAESAVVLHTSDRIVADSDEFIEPLRDATGIWFGGGRQWRLLDAYTGTKTEQAMREVIERGGVIGGSSAGATIQGDYLVRGNPLGNADMMSAGYEDGFCYLPGTAIDQHFTSRNRHPDMVLLKQHLPRLLGVGIDETTALIVTGARAEVIGQGKVFFYDGDSADQAGQRTEVASGQAYDLLERRLID